MLSLDLRLLGSGVLVNELESILVLSSLELILLVSNSLLVGIEVGIGGLLGGGGGSEISVLSIENVSILDLLVSSLQRSIKSSLVGLDSGLISISVGSESW